MTVRELMSQPPQTCQPDTDLAAVTRLMWDHDCGMVPVVDAGGRIVGVVTDRDICIATATRRLLPEHISAAQVMSRTLHTCMAGDTLEQALAVMKQARVRRLPVIDDEGHLQGVLSMNDLVRATVAKRGPAATVVVETLAAICAPRTIEAVA